MKNKGFTLIELIIVIAILGIIAAVALSSIARHDIENTANEPVSNSTAILIGEGVVSYGEPERVTQMNVRYIVNIERKEARGHLPGQRHEPVEPRQVKPIAPRHTFTPGQKVWCYQVVGSDAVACDPN
jgi:prepilin-type N-terminal cleavage/methylation domain-containing protein